MGGAGPARRPQPVREPPDEVMEFLGASLADPREASAPTSRQAAGCRRDRGTRAWEGASPNLLPVFMDAEQRAPP